MKDNVQVKKTTESMGENKIQKSGVRKLTPREYWRLMGFDDEDFEKASKVSSDTQLYKQAGNSIVVGILEAVLGQLLKEDITKGVPVETNTRRNKKL